MSDTYQLSYISSGLIYRSLTTVYYCMCPKKVAFGVLVSGGPVTLARTLGVLRTSGLLPQLGQLLVFVQVRLSIDLIEP